MLKKECLVSNGFTEYLNQSRAPFHYRDMGVVNMLILIRLYCSIALILVFANMVTYGLSHDQAETRQGCRHRSTPPPLPTSFWGLLLSPTLNKKVPNTYQEIATRLDKFIFAKILAL